MVQRNPHVSITTINPNRVNSTEDVKLEFLKPGYILFKRITAKA